MPNHNPGRNEPCWCGSGLKFKKCHWGRAKDQPIPLWEADHQLKSNYSKRCCSAPAAWKRDCSRGIVRAHTVPRSSSLKAIARDGHVYGIKPTLLNVAKHQGRLVPELIGINTASTFTGFCGKHDDQIFSLLEKRAFEVGNEQCFLLSYRALSRECYTKEAMLDTNELLGQLDRGKDLEQQMAVQMFTSMNRIGASAGVRDNRAHKSQLDHILITRDFSRIQSLVLELDSVQPVMAAGGTNPTHDFEGRNIQDLGELEEIPEMMTVTSFCSQNRGFIAWTWLVSQNGVCANLVQSLLRKPQQHLVAYSLQFILKNLENTFIEPFWWEGLNPKVREFAIDLINDSVNPLEDFNDTGLREVTLPIIQLPRVSRVHKINFT